MPNVGPFELIVILVVILLLFGASRLPKLARSLGQASHEFRKGLGDGHAEGLDEPDPNEKVTMTKAELDALLAEREAQARKDTPHS